MSMDTKSIFNFLKLLANNDITSARQAVVVSAIALLPQTRKGSVVNLQELYELYEKSFVYSMFREIQRGSVTANYAEWVSIDEAYLKSEGVELVNDINSIFEGCDPESTFLAIRAIMDNFVSKKVTTIGQIGLLIAIHVRPNQHFSEYTNGASKLIKKQFFSPLQLKKMVVADPTRKVYFLEPSTERWISKLLKTTTKTTIKVEKPQETPEILKALVAANRKNFVSVIELKYALKIQQSVKGMLYGKKRKEIISNIISDNLFLTKGYGALKLSLEGMACLNIVLAEFKREITENTGTMIRLLTAMSKHGIQTVEEAALIMATFYFPEHSIDYYVKNGFWTSSNNAVLQFFDRCLHVDIDDAGMVVLDEHINYAVLRSLGRADGIAPPPVKEVPVETPVAAVVVQEPVKEPEPAPEVQTEPDPVASKEEAEWSPTPIKQNETAELAFYDEPKTQPEIKQMASTNTPEPFHPTTPATKPTLTVEVRHKDREPTVLALGAVEGVGYYTRLESAPDGSTRIIVIEA